MNIGQLNCYVVREKIPNTNTFIANTPDSIAEFCYRVLRMGDIAKEQVVCFHLNIKSRVINYEIVSIGGLSNSSVHSREVFRGAICSGAAAIVLVHNHPSGDVNPSAPDNYVTKTIKESGDILDIKLIDHIIIGTEPNSYYSYRERGYFDGQN